MILNYIEYGKRNFPHIGESKLRTDIQEKISVTARDLMKEPITIKKSSSMYDMMKKLLECDISRLFVIDGTENIIGIISEKDVGLSLLSEITERKINEIPSSETMKPVLSVDESLCVRECAKMMIDRNIGSLGVCENKRITGILTKTDLVNYYLQNHTGLKKVRDVMTLSYVSGSCNDSIHDIISEMIRKRVSRIILKNQDGIPNGILTFRDIFQISMIFGKEDVVVNNTHSSMPEVSPRIGFISESGFGNATMADEVMTNNIVSVDHNDDLTSACRAMIENKINGVGVLTNDKLVGIVSKTDVTQAIASWSPFDTI